MTRQDILQAVRDFLAVLDEQVLVEDRERALRVALDRLALAYHFTEALTDDATSPDAPDVDGVKLRKRVESCFPELGYYNEALHITRHLGESALGIGDAIDDLVDIATELRQVLHHWENTSEAAALWHFRFGFEVHWGLHLRGLQRYLHERAF